MNEGIAVWETEGGATPQIAEPRGVSVLAAIAGAEKKMLGTGDQVDWAEQIRVRVSADFDRLARALELAAPRHGERDREYIHAVIAVLEDKRAEVMAKDQAGYFIHNWQELRDQVRQMIVQDPRYRAMKARTAEKLR